MTLIRAVETQLLRRLRFLETDLGFGMAYCFSDMHGISITMQSFTQRIT
mgnify:CR=1